MSEMEFIAVMRRYAVLESCTDQGGAICPLFDTNACRTQSTCEAVVMGLAVVAGKTEVAKTGCAA